MNTRKIFAWFFIFSAALVCFAGCAQLRPGTDPALDKKARDLANQATRFNHQILTSKGTGWARLETKTKSETVKIAWAAKFPNRIRLTVLLSGLPMETVIATGVKITFLSHTGEHDRVSYYSKDPDMKELFGVSIKLSEIIQVLLGRFPLKEFNDVYFSPKDPSFSTLILKQKWNRMTQYLHFSNNKIPDDLQSFDTDGNLMYKLLVSNYKTFNTHMIPQKIDISDPNLKRIQLDIITFQANPAIKESVFLLTAPL